MNQTNPNQSLEHIKSIKTAHESSLLKLANVVGVGIGLKEENGQLTDRLAIIVNVSDKKPLHELAPKNVVPPEIEGVPTDVQETGQFRAFSS